MAEKDGAAELANIMFAFHAINPGIRLIGSEIRLGMEGGLRVLRGMRMEMKMERMFKEWVEYTGNR